MLLRSRATYTSAVGPITVERTLYRAGSARSVAPLELRAGIIGGHWTPWRPGGAPSKTFWWRIWTAAGECCGC